MIQGVRQPTTTCSERPATPWHALPAVEVMARLQTGPEGLSAEQARRRREHYGPNALQAEPGPSLRALVLKQFASPLIYMLLAAAAIAGLSAHWVDIFVILGVVVLNTVIGVTQEWRAEKALEALRALAAPQARVMRAARPVTIPADAVVPGDLLLLESGDRVAADARVVEAAELYADESALTGESAPVEKSVPPLPEDTPFADRHNMVWMATAVTSGRGRAVAVATGMQTAMGEIAEEVQAATRAPTPLQRRLASFGGLLGIAAVSLSVLIFLIGLLRGYHVLDMLLFAVAAAVSAIPEGLPAAMTVVLALGVQRMARRHAIVRRLPAVETLGSTTVVCSDKTGTITRNEMTVTRIWAGGTLYEVTGEGFSPRGEIRPLDEGPPPGENPDLRRLLEIGILANDAALEHGENGWQVHGDPTEAALLVAACKLGLDPDRLREVSPRRGEVPFSSARQYMASLHAGAGARLYVKGAPERVLAFCTHLLEGGEPVLLDEARRRRVLDLNRQLAGQALRVLGGAYKEFPGPGSLEAGAVERDLVFAGLWGMMDPARPEAVRAIGEAQQAGMRVVMITGDHADTAAAIAAQVGILHEGTEVVDGRALAHMPDDVLHRRALHIGVYARVSPGDKLRIVEALQRNDQIVAMTGDGVNDAPALKQANIGIAMGITGTEVAKEAADMVLTDDNFATIINAVAEGRVIFDNIRRVVFFLIATNLGEIITLTAALLLGLPLPLTAVMILWVNVVTDGVSTVPLGVEPGHGDVLRRPPRPPGSGILSRHMVRDMLLLAALMATGTLGLFAYELGAGSPRHARTVAFSTIVAFQWFHALNSRSRRASLFTLGLWGNSWLLAAIGAAVSLQALVIYWGPARVAFQTLPMSALDWLLTIGVAATILVLGEFLKWLNRRAGGAAAGEG